MYTYEKVDWKKVELILCNISTVVAIKIIYMYVWATKYESHNLGDSAYNLNALMFAFKTGVALYKKVQYKDFAI